MVAAGSEPVACQVFVRRLALFQAECATGRPSEPPECVSSRPRLTREQVLSLIVDLNPSASARFLARFADDSLETYLHRLQLRRDLGTRPARWVRESVQPAIVFRESE